MMKPNNKKVFVIIALTFIWIDCYCMNDDSFWNLTEKLGSLVYTQDDKITSMLDKMSTDELIDYYKTIEIYRSKAYTREIFEIGAILN